MDIMVGLAMSGAKETMMAQAVNTHNLANASTAGFRSDLIRFNGEDIGISEGSRMSNSVDFSHGILQATKRTLDVAIDGEGWMAIQTPVGETAYTRRGDLRIDANGQLSNGSGNKIIGNNGPISIPPFGEIEIGTDGTISIQPIGQSPNALAIVDRISLVSLNQNALFKNADGYLLLPEDEITVPDASSQLLSGTLEGSNVNPIEAMVRMIDLARKFESQIKMMQTSEENDQTMASVLRIR